MEVWVIPLLAAIGGAAVALIGKEFLEWYKRPRLQIDFEEREREKPCVVDFNDEGMTATDRTYRIKYLRLIVRNKGKKPAMDCEAKLAITTDIESDITNNKVALHWSRRDPVFYRRDTFSDNAEKVFAPINLNINDEEIVDVLKLSYSYSNMPDVDHSPKRHTTIESVSPRQLVLQPGTIYRGTVTVYSSNTNPKSFKFKVNWDGSVERFKKAFTK